MRIFEEPQFWFSDRPLFSNFRKRSSQHSLKEEKISNLKKAFKNNGFLINLPPTAGLGIGLDRLFTILLNKRSIQDIIYFPFVRRKE